MLFKLKWFVSTLILYPFFRKILLPSYVSFPLFFVGLDKVEIGRKVRIFPNLRIEVHGSGSIIIEDNVGIGQNFHITSAGKLHIKSGVTILANVFVTNIDHEYRDINKNILEQGNIINDTVIGENCFIGIGASIQAGTILGKHCIVGTNSVVRGNYPDYSVIVGAPGKVVKRYDSLSQSWKRTDNEGNFI